jgi:hypothetical protein
MSPVAGSIVATAASELDHAPPDTVELKVVVPEVQMACVPESVPAVGAAFTVTVLVPVALEHPPVAATV